MLLEVDLGPRIKALPPRIRVAVAAACAERVLPLFEVMSERGVATARAALRLAWSWAEGQEIDPRARRSALSTIEELLPKEHDDRGLAVRTLERAGSAIVKALEATAIEEADYSAQAAALSVKMAQAAVHGFELAEDGKMWAMEEQSFQERMLALAESGDVARVRAGTKEEKSPSFLDWLEEEWGWDRDDDEGDP